jgi:hypothetical protein
MPKVELTLEANVAALKKQLAGVFDKKTATAMIKEYKAAFKEQKKAAEAAAKANKKARKEQDKLTDALEGTKNAAEAVGGKVGEMAGRFEKGQAVGKFSAALGPAGPVVLGLAAITLGAAAAAAAVVGTVGAMGALVARADDLIDQNKELAEFFDPVDPEGLAAIYEFNDALAAAEATGRQLQIVMAAGIGPSMVKLIDIVGRLTFEIMETEKGWRNFFNAMEIVTGGAFKHLVVFAKATERLIEVTDEATEGMGEGYEDLKDGVEALRLEQEREKEEAEAAAKAREAAAKAAKAQREADKLAAEAAREAAAAQREAAAAARERERAEDTLNAMIERATADQRDAYQELTLQYEKQIEAIQAQGKAGADFELQVKALTEVVSRYERDLDELNKAQEELADPETAQRWRDAWQQAFEGVSDETKQTYQDIKDIGGSLGSSIQDLTATRIDVLQREADATREAAEASAEAYRAAEVAKVEAALEAGQITEAEAESQLGLIENTQTAEEAAAEARIALMEREAIKAFKINKAISIAAATIKAAEAAIALMVPLAGLGPAAPLAAAAIAGLALAAQIAAIEAVEPPSFASGGLVADRVSGDHTPILASPTEGIVSARGMSTLGRDGLNQINAGGSIGTEVIVSLDRQIIAQAVADVLTGDRRVRAEVRAISGARTGQALPYGRGR